MYLFSIKLLLLSIILSISCTKEATNKKNTLNSSNPTVGPSNPSYPPPSNPPPPPYTPPPSTGGGSCPFGSANAPGTPDAGQTIEYYKLNSPEIVAHGATAGTIVFSSASDLPGNYNQNIFYSDSRFNLRVIPKYQNKGVDSRGIPCAYSPQPFTKMNIGVVVRSQQSNPGVGAYYQFKDVPVNCPSRVHEYQIPATSTPLVIEVMNVEWDYSCLSYAQQGYPNVPGVCPYDNVWQTECYKLEIQFATDTTTNIPGTRTY